MSNYDLEEVKLVNWQMTLSKLFLLSIIISLTLSYNEKLKLKKQKPLYTKKEEKNILIFNRLLVVIIGIGFLLINKEDKTTKIKFNKGNLKNANLQINASIISLIASILVLYISFKDSNEQSLENPEL